MKYNPCRARWGWGVRGLVVLANGLLGCEPTATSQPEKDTRFLTYTADPRREHLALYWLDGQRQPLRSLGYLRDWLAGQGQQLVFACNGGMYRAGNVPVGLLVENGQIRTPLDTSRGAGNFYLRPNGVFYLTARGQAGICATADFGRVGPVRYATQSGPLLVAAGQLHPALRAGSGNVHLRNGVGVLPNGNVLFVLSKQKVNFYDLARYFQQRGCREALYLDGFVSRAYLPAKGWRQTDGDFGAMIGVTKPLQ